MVVADQARRPRHDRRRAALDRRSVPAEEDRGRPRSTTSASASAATSASPATTTMARRSAARRTRPWARNGARGWHPERIAGEELGRDAVLIVGAGPAGLEARRRSGKRGYEVHLAEAARELGGRVTRESAPAGPRRMGARARLARRPDRAGMANVSIYRESPMSARRRARRLAPPHVVLATGASWRRDGFGRNNWHAGRRIRAGVDVSRPTMSWTARCRSRGRS